jgi:RNA polymerase sigma factor (TIGR02999 family)
MLGLLELWVARLWLSNAMLMSDVTRILSRIESGDPSASEQLLPLVYQELRRLAAQRLTREPAGQTLQATALVHEAYLRLVDGEQQQQWNSRGHFFSAAAEAMRRILIENARRKKRLKHGGGHQRVGMDQAEIAIGSPTDDLLALDEAMHRLGEQDPVKAQLVELRFFAGLSVEEAADVLGISGITAKRYWRYARAWLRRSVSESDDARTD